MKTWKEMEEFSRESDANIILNLELGIQIRFCGGNGRILNSRTPEGSGTFGDIDEARSLRDKLEQLFREE